MKNIQCRRIHLRNLDHLEMLPPCSCWLSTSIGARTPLVVPVIAVSSVVASVSSAVPASLVVPLAGSEGVSKRVSPTLSSAVLPMVPSVVSPLLVAPSAVTSAAVVAEFPLRTPALPLGPATDCEFEGGAGASVVLKALSLDPAADSPVGVVGFGGTIGVGGLSSSGSEGVERGTDMVDTTV